MSNLIAALRRLLSWLAEPECRSDAVASLPDWADLPVHHPNAG